MVTSGGSLLGPSKLINLIILGSLWVHEALGGMLTSIVSNSHFGKHSAARVMIILASIFYPMTDLPDLDLQIFKIISKLMDLDVQIFDLELQIISLNGQIYDFLKFTRRRPQTTLRANKQYLTAIAGRPLLGGHGRAREATGHP